MISTVDTHREIPSDVFHIGLVNPLERITPYHGINFANMSTLWQIYEPIYRSTIRGEVEPVLLDYPLRREANGPGGSTVYSAAVQPGHFFSDGTEVTADRIVSSLQKTPSFMNEASVSARDNRVFFTLKRPNANFKFTLGRHDYPIVLEHDNTYLGTGPYMFAANAAPEGFRLIRNPYYKGGVGPREVICTIYPIDQEGGRTKLRDAVRRGDVDFTEDLSREELNSVQSMRKFIDLGFCTAILFFNTERLLFADRRVRWAFAHAIDRKALAGQSYSNALAFAASGLLPPSLGSSPDGLMTNLTRAKELLSEANVKPPADPLMLFVVPVPRPHLPQPCATAEMLVSQFGQLGFQFQIRQARNVAEYYDIGSKGSYDLLLSGWIPDSSDPLDFMEAVLASYRIPLTSTGETAGHNMSRWTNAAVDEALQSQRTQPSENTWKRICDLASKEMPLVPLMYGPRVALVSWRVKKFPRNFSYRPFLSEIEL